ncbi:MAG: Ig-like domain-containing protein, partial [Cyclobacteriaceae bacterium]
VHFAVERSDNVMVEASFLDHLITSNKSVSHIIIDNLELKGANSRAISFVGGRNIKVRNCTVRFSGETGLYFSGTKDLVIENNEVSDSNINGIFLGAADNAHISSNRILRTFLFPGLGGNGDNKGAGIFSNGNHNKIEFNEVISSGYIGIRFGGENTMVNNNLVNFFCMTKNDGGGIYAYTGNKNTNYTNRKIINNIILNGKGVREGTNIQSPLSMPQAEGIYLDDNSSGVEVRGNTIANNSSRGIFLHNARDITVDNNLIYNNHLQMYFKNDHLGEDINNIEIKNNIFLSTKPEQNSLSIWTKGDDISHMGKFESNIYANPFTDNYRINTLVNAGKTHQTTSVFDLDAWKEKYQKDVSSGIQPINIPVYEVKNEIGENKIENGTFDQHANYINCVGGISEWDNSAKLDGGALKISGSGSFNTTFNIGNVVEGKQYIVRFSAVSNQTLAAKTYLQQRGTPWAKASAISVIQTDKERKEYELLFTAAKSLERTSLLIRIENVNNSELFLDNIAFHEAEILPIDPEKKILFEFNASNEDKSIPLYGKFMDMKGNFHSGNIKIAPFSSILLIRTSEEETLIPNLKFISPTSQSKITAKDLELILEMNGDSTYIDRIDFYSDQKLLGSTGAGTFVFTWKDVPEGKHAIYAIGRNEGSRQSLSDTLSVTIEHENLIPVINMDLPKNPQFLKAGEHVFLSSTAVDLDGMISQVQFFEGKNLLATLDSAPFEFNWKDIKAGNYQVFSKATDSKGL